MAFSDRAKLIAELILLDKLSGPAKTATGSLGKLDSATGRVGKSVGIMGHTISTALGVGLERAVAGGIGLLKSSLEAGVEGANKLQAVQAQTQAALKSTGGVSGQTAASIRNLAEKYEGLNATIDDKVIQANENLLLSFTNIKKDAFEPTLQAALDLNTRLGGGEEGLQGVILKLGRAMQDPAKGLSLLTRSGVKLDDATVKQITSLQKQNKLFDAQQLLLKALGRRYGGAFATEGKTAAASQKALGDAVEDLQIQFAQGLMPGLQNVRDALSKTFRDPAIKTAVGDLGTKIGAFLSPANIQKGIGLIKDSFGTIKNVATSIPWGAIGTALQIGGKGAKAILDAFNSAPSWVQTAVVTGWGLNKLTGGLVGNLFGQLASGLIKGVLGINAGVVNVNAAVVNGGVPGGGVPVAGPVGRAIPTILKGALAVGAGVVIGKEIAQAINAPIIGPAKQFEGDQFAKAIKATDLSKLHADLDAINAQLNTSDTSTQVALIASRIPYIGDALGNVAPELEKQRDALVAQIKELEFKQNTAAAVAAGQRRKTADGISNVNIHSLATANAARITAQNIASTAARTHGYLSKVASVDAATAANTAAVARKNFSPTVNVGVNVTSVVSVNAIQRAITANSIRMTRLGVL